MRPRRILRRFVARARHWGTPHVHCPSCGGDNPVPDGPAFRDCFVCHVTWCRVELPGDPTDHLAAVQARVPEGRPWAAVFQPLLVDVPDGDGKRTEPLQGVAFLYLP